MKLTIVALILILLTGILSGCGAAPPTVDTAAVDNANATAQAAQAEAQAAKAEAEAAKAEVEAVKASQAEVEAAAAEVEANAPAAEAPANSAELVFLVFESPVLTAEFWDNAIADALKGLDNVTVKKIVSPGIDRTTYAKQLLASGQLPDLMQSINTQEFIEAEILTPWDSQWIEEHFELPYGNALGGQVWHAPTNAQVVPFMFYNKDIFAKAGVEPPTTWTEFQEAVAKLADAGYKPLQVVGAGDAWATNMMISALVSTDVLGKTPDWVQKRKAGEVKFTDADMAGAWQKLGWLVENGYIDQGDLGMGYADANRAFLDGEVAMYPMGSWFLQQAGKEAKFEPGVFLLPNDEGQVIVPFNVGGGTHVSAQSQHPEEAMAFAQAFALSPSVMKPLIENDSAFPLIKGMAIDDYGLEGMTDLFYDGYGYVSLADSTQVDAFAWVNNDNAPISGMVDEINKSAQSIITGADPQAELERLDQVWDSLAE